MDNIDFIDISNHQLDKMDNLFEVYKYEDDGDNKVFKYNVSFDKLIFPDEADNLTPLDYMYREILISYLARYANINCVKPRFAKYNDRYGIIEENFIEDGCTKLNGADIMQEYVDHLISENKISLENETKEFYIISKMNTLDSIKKSLYYHFRNDEDCDEIVEELFEELVKRFAFDYVTLQTDRSLANWSILESPGKFPKLSKMYDNERAFMSNGYDMKVLNPDENVRTMITNLCSMGSKYFDIFTDVINHINPDILIAAIFRMELECGEIDEKVKDIVIKSFMDKYETTIDYIDDIKSLKRR